MASARPNAPEEGYRTNARPAAPTLEVSLGLAPRELRFWRWVSGVGLILTVWAPFEIVREVSERVARGAIAWTTGRAIGTAAFSAFLITAALWMVWRLFRDQGLSLRLRGGDQALQCDLSKRGEDLGGDAIPWSDVGEFRLEPTSPGQRSTAYRLVLDVAGKPRPIHESAIASPAAWRDRLRALNAFVASARADALARAPSNVRVDSGEVPSNVRVEPAEEEPVEERAAAETKSRSA